MILGGKTLKKFKCLVWEIKIWFRMIYDMYIKPFFIGNIFSDDLNKKMAIIVPFRKRDDHLQVFVRHMQKFLKNRNFIIVVIEQSNEKLFNRAKLFNIGYDLVKDDVDYVCFHDVDLLPESSYCNYQYPLIPVHLALFCSQFKYKYLPFEYFGGVNLFNKKDFEKINGFSNEYWGWGKEDDDLLKRIKNKNLPYIRIRGRYFSLYHKRESEKAMLQKGYLTKNSKRLNSNYNYDADGLSNIKYNILKKGSHKHYTKYTVKI